MRSVCACLLLAVVGAGCVSPKQNALRADDAAASDDDGPAAGRTPNMPVGIDGSAGHGGPADVPQAPPADGAPAFDAPPAPPDAAVDPTCGGGKHRCSIGCVDNDDPIHCGAGCELCPTPYNGSPICGSAGCDVRCDSGFHACDKVCYPDDDAGHCGASCTHCQDPPGGVATCKNDACNAFCMNSYNSCNGMCYPQDDVTHCGSACVACPTPARGKAICNNHCDIACVSGELACGGTPPACVAPLWNFESGTAEGWSLKTGAGQHNAGGPVYVSGARTHGGSHALASDVTVNAGQDAYVVTIELTLCASGGLDLGDKTISMWAYFDGPPVDSRVVADPYVYTTSGTSYDPLSYGSQMSRTPLTKQWFEIKAMVPATTDHTVYKMNFFTNLNIDGWTGTIYLDDITLQ